MNNVVHHFDCKKCGQSKGVMLSQLIDFEKDTMTHTYRCDKCKETTEKTYPTKKEQLKELT